MLIIIYILSRINTLLPQLKLFLEEEKYSTDGFEITKVYKIIRLHGLHRSLKVNDKTKFEVPRMSAYAAMGGFVPGRFQAERWRRVLGCRRRVSTPL